MLQVYSQRYAKAPERRRRSFWSRLWRHPARLLFAVLMLNVVLGGAAYSTLRANGRLPSQIRARRENDAFDRWLHGPAFQRGIVEPLEALLAGTRVTDAELERFVQAHRVSSRFDIGMPPVYIAPKQSRSETIQRWRSTIEALDERGIRVYGSIRQLQEGEAWLRQFIESRTPPVSAGVDLRPLLEREAFSEVAMTEIAARLQVARDELNGILFVASRLEEQRRDGQSSLN